MEEKNSTETCADNGGTCETFEFSVVFAIKPGQLSKVLTLKDGKLNKEAGGNLLKGAVERRRASVTAFAELLQTLSPRQALTFGICEHARAFIDTASHLQKAKPSKFPVIARTREYFSWPDGAGLMMLDYDPAPGDSPLSRGDLLSALYVVCPALQNAPHIWAVSASSCIFRADTGEALRGIAGQRVYVPVMDASDIPRAGAALLARSWLTGYGRYEVSKSGSLLDRALFDGAVWQPERLDFAGGAKLGPGLEQRRPAPVAFNPEFAVLDTLSALPDLTEEEGKRLAKLKDEARELVEPRCAEARQAWIGERLQGLKKRAKKAGKTLSDGDAHEILTRAVTHKRLSGSFEIETEKFGKVTVAEILADPGKFDAACCFEPLEPEYRGGDNPRIARLNTKAVPPFIWSFAHGGVKYVLEREVERLILHEGALHWLTDKILAGMRADGVVYETAGGLSRISGGRLVPVNSEWLRWYLSGLFAFQRMDARSRKFVPKDCPLELARTILSLQGGWKLPKLDAIITAPTITPDGEIIQAEGYYERHRIFLEFRDASAWRGIDADAISESELRHAIETIWRPFQNFPFVDATARGGYLVAILTAITRPTMETAPGFLITAPTMASGKSFLAFCLSELAGERPEVLLMTGDEDELRKRLTAVTREGSRVLLFDNLSGHLKSDVFCGVLTSGMLKDRVLGASVTTSNPIRALIVFTGNNVTPVEDISRRLITVRIDPGTEKPWTRRFDLHPVQWCREHRLEMVRAGIILLRAYAEAVHSKPCLRPASALASFENWSDFVRGCVCWIGKKGILDVSDPEKSISQNFLSDPETNKLRALISAWSLEFSNKPSTVANAIQIANFRKNFEFFQALDEIAGEKGGINPRRLGRWIERQTGRIIDGKRFIRDGERNHTVRWKVMGFGDSGDCYPKSGVTVIDSYRNSSGVIPENPQNPFPLNGSSFEDSDREGVI